MKKELQILHQELENENGKFWLITEIYNANHVLSFTYKIPEEYQQEDYSDYESVERYHYICPN